MEPQFAFSIPSIEDDTPLDCRIYHPKDPRLASPGGVKGAILAHPYAPLGGSYDDHVVLAVTQTLLKLGFIVGTFNFRGAGDSVGRTSWTGKPEIQDYVAFAGFMIYYLHALGNDSALLSSGSSREPTDLLLAGYSYGSLVLARLPSTTDIIDRFESAEAGTAAAEIILRARTLAKQTMSAQAEQQSPLMSRGRTLQYEKSPTSPSKHVSPMTMGGEETDPSDRRRSRDSRRSVDVIRKSVEIPQRIKAHVKQRHTSETRTGDYQEAKLPKTTGAAAGASMAPKISPSYLMISPVLLPFSSSLLPPGAPTSTFAGAGADSKMPKQYLKHSTLAVFGPNDAFTSAKRLQQWAGKQASASEAEFTWAEIDGAGHFWGEAGALKTLQRRVSEWTRKASRGDG